MITLQVLGTINEISDKLKEDRIYHKIIKNTILTRRSKTKMPSINKEIIYILGVLEGDGCMTKTKRKRGGYHYLLRIYSGNKNYLLSLEKLFEKNFLSRAYISKDKRKESAFCLEIRKAPIFFYFNLLGISHGKKKERGLPKYLQSNKTHISHYLAGLIDTDGSVYNRRIQLKQKSKTLMLEIKKTLEELKLAPSEVKINYTDNVPFYYLRFNNNLPLRLKKVFKQNFS